MTASSCPARAIATPNTSTTDASATDLKHRFGNKGKNNLLRAESSLLRAVWPKWQHKLLSKPLRFKPRSRLKLPRIKLSSASRQLRLRISGLHLPRLKLQRALRLTTSLAFFLNLLYLSLKTLWLPCLILQLKQASFQTPGRLLESLQFLKEVIRQRSPIIGQFQSCLSSRGSLENLFLTNCIST